MQVGLDLVGHDELQLLQVLRLLEDVSFTNVREQAEKLGFDLIEFLGALTLSDTVLDQLLVDFPLKLIPHY